MKHPFKALLLASTLTLGFPVLAFAVDDVRMPDRSAPAQKTIEQFLEGGQVTRGHETTKNNAPVFQDEVKRADGSKTTVQVAPDGELIERRRD